jgi:hypothetical protein
VEFPATWAQRRQLSASARWSSRELITRFMALSQA